jgi:predicted aspartyl protease
MQRRRTRILTPLALLALTSTALAGTDPLREARAVVERYVVATGGRAALEADTLLHRSGRMKTSGMEGRWEDWRRGSDRLLGIQRLGMLRTKTGLDGMRGWSTDFTSKQVNRLEGKDLDALRAQAWFESEMWARDTTSRAILGAAAFLPGRSLQSVEITPPVGPKKTYWFDKATGLLARITHVRDHHDWNEEVSGWKLLAGRRRPTVFATGFPQFPSTYSRTDVDSVHVRAPRAPDGFAPPASTATPVIWKNAKHRVELPFRYQRGHVWVRVSVNGAPPGEFILDTGAFNTCLDRGYAQTLGLVAEGEHVAQGVGGHDTFGYSKLASLAWTTKAGVGVEMRDLRVGVIELQDALSSLEWGRTAGLLGYDVLSRFALELDFDRQVLVLHDPVTFQYAGRGAAVPMTLHGNIPTVEVTLNGTCKGTYIVDVGNASVLSVGAEQVEACRLFAQRRKDVQHLVGGIGGAFTQSVCRMDSLEIGPFRMLGPVVGLSSTRRGGAGSKEIQGNLGTTVLERFRCTFDYAGGTLWLEPAAHYADREAFTRSGLWFTRWAGVVIVHGVVKGSPAAEAGFKVRDVLRAVDGRRIERWTPEELDRVLRDGAPGRTVRVTYERDLREETVELTLADVL